MPLLNLCILCFSLLRLSTIAIADQTTPSNTPSTDSSLTWGPYRPNLYFGMRPRIPETLLLGLMWGRVDNDQSISNLRYTCEQDEAMDGYGWKSYDPRQGGTQVIHDAVNQLDLTTQLVKIPGEPHGGNWGVRITGRLRSDAPHDLRTTVIFHIAMEAASYDRLDPNLACAPVPDNEHAIGTAVCQGTATGLGNFSIRTFESVGNIGVSHAFSGKKELQNPQLIIHNITAPETDIWKAKSIFLGLKKGSSNLQKKGQDSSFPHTLRKVSAEPRKGNMQFLQKTFEGNFDFDILYSSKSAPTPMTSSDLTMELHNILPSFELKFNLTWAPKSPFQGHKYREFSQSLLSNLMGGIGYFYGNNSIDTSFSTGYQESGANFWDFAENARPQNAPESRGPFELFSSVPSRPFFPRGFLWNEGFHLQVILDWDMDLALNILNSWFSLMDEDGWIAREQILGPEAESKVPKEFRIQYPHHANPPIMFWVLAAFLDRLTNESAYSGTPSHYLQDPGAGNEYLKAIYPLLLRHYNWFRRTQSGQLKKRPGVSEGYRWRGRTPQHCFTSGLDDYPRAEPPHPEELHVDAISWVGLMAKFMLRISKFLDMTDDQKMFGLHIQGIKESIERLHWSDEHQTYCDATIEHETHVLKCHKGYVSLFPFLVGLLESEDPRLEAMLDLIRNEKELWSPYGLRSLSKNSPLYGTDENYWRGPIWVNINYMVLKRLQHLAYPPGPFQKRSRTIYTELRQNLVSTVYKSWRSTGFAWEQYNPETGAGQRTQHFTGWTALIVKIMALPDLAEQRPPQRWFFDNGEKWWLKLKLLIIVVALILGSWFRRELLKLWRALVGLYFGKSSR